MQWGKAWCSTSARVSLGSLVQKLLFTFLFLVPIFVVSGCVVHISLCEANWKSFNQFPLLWEHLTFPPRVFVDAHIHLKYVWFGDIQALQFRYCYIFHLKIELIYRFCRFYQLRYINLWIIPTKSSKGRCNCGKSDMILFWVGKKYIKYAVCEEKVDCHVRC